VNSLAVETNRSSSNFFRQFSVRFRVDESIRGLFNVPIAETTRTRNQF